MKTTALSTRCTILTLWEFKCLKPAGCSFVPRARIKWHASNSCPHSFFRTLPPSSGSRPPSPHPFIGTFSQLSSDPAHNDDLRRVPSLLEPRRCRPASHRSQTPKKSPLRRLECSVFVLPCFNLCWNAGLRSLILKCAPPSPQVSQR